MAEAAVHDDGYFTNQRKKEEKERKKTVVAADWTFNKKLYMSSMQYGLGYLYTFGYTVDIFSD